MDSSTFKAIVTNGKGPYVVNEEFGQLQPGQVLVKVLAATINNVDKIVAHGMYEAPEFKDNPEYGVGYEGAGVVEDGYGDEEKKLIGTIVAVFQDPALPNYQGCWRQYLYLNAKEVVPFPEGTDPESICSVTNPITTFPMMEQIQDGNHKGVILTAACSAIGKMIIRKCRKLDIATICIVRKSQQRETLERMGAEHVLLQDSKTFKEDLGQLAGDLGATILFDPVGGDLTTQVMSVMPPKSTISFMDNMSRKKITLDPLEIIFGQREIKAVNLSEWMKTQSEERIGQVIGEIAGDLAQGGEIYGTEIYTSYSLDDYKLAFEQSSKTASRGKTIFKPASS